MRDETCHINVSCMQGKIEYDTYVWHFPQNLVPCKLICNRTKCIVVSYMCYKKKSIFLVVFSLKILYSFFFSEVVFYVFLHFQRFHVYYSLLYQYMTLKCTDKNVSFIVFTEHLSIILCFWQYHDVLRRIFECHSFQKS